jgi:hypothetical protein
MRADPDAYRLYRLVLRAIARGNLTLAWQRLRLLRRRCDAAAALPDA